MLNILLNFIRRLIGMSDRGYIIIIFKKGVGDIKKYYIY